MTENLVVRTLHAVTQLLGVKKIGYWPHDLGSITLHGHVKVPPRKQFNS